ncbi:hypothetical protein FB451DRAFT_1407757 [Mycena latifolia]|nr:hypothetical protein FB451DRAFT_1407757 [Mycena latifolia]
MLKYVSRVTQEEWEGLSQYASGKFDDWLAEIESLFPEIRTVKIGSLIRLTEIAEEYKGLKKTDQGKIKRYGVAFKNEAAKLVKPPSLVTNPILVDKYLTVFEPNFAAEIETMISQTMYWKPTLTVATNVERPEETIPLADLLVLVEKLTKVNTSRNPTMANLTASKEETLAGSSAVSVGSSIGSRDFQKMKVEVSDRLDAFAGEIANVKDSLKLSEDRAKANLEKSLLKLEASFKVSLNQAIRGPAPHQETASPGQVSNKEVLEKTYSFKSGGATDRGMECYYCYLTGHMVRDCPYKKEDIDRGRVLIENNRMKLGDGTPFPKWPENRSQKQRVDDYYANKMVVGAPMVLTQFYEHPTPETRVSQFQAGIIDDLRSTYDCRDDEARTVCVQKYIREHTGGSNHPVATYQVSSYQQGQIMPSGGGAVQTYVPVQQPVYAPVQQPNYAPAQPAFAPVQSQLLTAMIQPEAGSAIPPGMNLTQLVQLFDAFRSANHGLPATQDQFVHTRGSTRDSTSGNPNF